jgi:hypothetical protein
MTGDITKAELQAMIEVQTKAASQMEKVAGSLNIIVENQKSIIGQNKQACDILSGCVECKKNIVLTLRDVTFIKWMLGSVTAVVALGILILQVLEKFH